MLEEFRKISRKDSFIVICCSVLVFLYEASAWVHASCCVYGLCPWSGILNTKQHDALESGPFPSSGDGKEIPTLLSSVERAKGPLIEVSSF
jgi:hypothetical protein